MNRKRIYTTLDWCAAMAKRQRPARRFTGRTRRDYARWRRQFARRYREMLGRFPERVPLRAAVRERRVCARYVRGKEAGPGCVRRLP